MVADRAFLKGGRLGAGFGRLEAEIARILAALAATGAMRVEPAALDRGIRRLAVATSRSSAQVRGVRTSGHGWRSLRTLGRLRLLLRICAVAQVSARCHSHVADLR